MEQVNNRNMYKHFHTLNRNEKLNGIQQNKKKIHFLKMFQKCAYTRVYRCILCDSHFFQSKSMYIRSIQHKQLLQMYVNSDSVWFHFFHLKFAFFVCFQFRMQRRRIYFTLQNAIMNSFLFFFPTCYYYYYYNMTTSDNSKW